LDKKEQGAGLEGKERAKQETSNESHNRHGKAKDGPFGLLALHRSGDAPVAIDLHDHFADQQANKQVSIE
jgi:hypothetical protein